jgi:D-sedoheptulose 7-phosphate isomerase
MQFSGEIVGQLQEASHVLENFLAHPENIEKIEKAAQLMSEAIKSGNKIFSCGNGGSHCDAMHFAEELTGQFRDRRQALPAISISDASHITCTANDYGFNEIFSRYIAGLGKEGDVLFCLSTSGNSANIVKAVEEARTKNMKTIALTGKSGGQLATLADIEIRVPHQGYSDRIQEVHIKIIHILIYLIEKLVV